ncbi:hypothetical protein JOE61_000176 [Nocardioides salarius]|uniref:Uncharacterized protein n=1 Tax=Nocardioides salarius TaxID=374513 RepID=A0ABS2M590_9ACTN|nr:hypothetical protein [Nocardioides salarius]
MPTCLSTRVRASTRSIARTVARRGGRPLTDRGGATGTPSHDLDEAPPSLAQETNWVVSGGGLVGRDGTEPRRARRSR